MHFIVLFEDNTDIAADMRQRYMPAHLSFLEKNSDRIKSAGPLNDLAGEAAGGLWIVEANDATTVDNLVKTDPFWETGLRKSVNIMAWNQVYANGTRTITV